MRISDWSSDVCSSDLLSIVCETYWVDRLAKLGWNPQPLGPPMEHRGEAIIGLIVDMGEAALETTRQAYAISRSVLWAQSCQDTSRSADVCQDRKSVV